MPKTIYEDRKPLQMNFMFIWCQYCQKTWSRGGKGAGFRKAGAQRHVFSCFEKSVAKRGLKLGRWSENKGGYRLVKLPSGDSGNS